MKILLGFFGLNRSLKWTWKSIDENIIKPVKKSTHDVIIIGHFNVPYQITNPRSGEKSISYKNHSLDNIDFDYLVLEKQKIENIEDFRQNLSEAQYFNEAVNSQQVITNHLHQLYSLSQLYGLLKLKNFYQADVFFFLRPDLQYLNTVNFTNIFNQISKGDADLITPDWHLWKGLNDRIAICSKLGAKAYLKRIYYIEDFYKASGYIHAEQLLKFGASKSNLKLAYFDLKGVRVRANGYTSLESFSLPAIHFIKFKVRNLFSKTGLLN